VLVFTLPKDTTYYVRMASMEKKTTGTYRILTAWDQQNGERARDHRDIFVTSSDDGVTWSPTVRTNDSEGNLDDWLPEVAVDGTGRVFSAHYDYRDEPTVCNAPSNVYLTRSDDGGSTWLPETRISDVSTNWSTTGFNLEPNQGDYIGLFARDTLVIVGWGDGRPLSMTTTDSDPNVFAIPAPLAELLARAGHRGGHGRDDARLHPRDLDDDRPGIRGARHPAEGRRGCRSRPDDRRRERAARDAGRHSPGADHLHLSPRSPWFLRAVRRTRDRAASLPGCAGRDRGRHIHHPGFGDGRVVGAPGIHRNAVAPGGEWRLRSADAGRARHRREDRLCGSRHHAGAQLRISDRCGWILQGVRGCGHRCGAAAPARAGRAEPDQRRPLRLVLPDEQHPGDHRALRSERPDGGVAQGGELRARAPRDQHDPGRSDRARHLFS
jgi:hypothetical protein